MALLWLDGFDMYGDTTGAAPSPTSILDRRYTASNGEGSCDIETGRTGNSIEGGGSTTNLQISSLTTNGTLIVGFAFKIIDYIDLQAGKYTRLCQLREGSTESIVVRTVGATLEIYSGTVILDTVKRLHLRLNTWYYFEIKATCDNTTGTYEMRLNGSTISSGTGLDTRQGALGYFDGVTFGSDWGDTMSYDDLYICDGSGSVNNDFLGPIHVHTITPNAAGATNNFTSGTYTDIDEAAKIDDDTTYAETTTSGHRITANYTDTNNYTSIKGLVVNNVISANASLNVAVVTISGATTNVSANITVNTTSNSTYNTKIYVSELDPNTSTAWTPNTVNSAEFGIELK